MLPSSPLVEIQSASVGIRSPLGARLGWTSLGALVIPFLYWILVPSNPSAWYAPLGPVMQLLASASPVGMLMATVLMAYSGRARGTLRVGDGVIAVERGGRRREFPIGLATRGWVAPLRHEVRVEIELRTGHLVTARVKDAAQAQVVLDAAGVDVRQRTFRASFGDASTRFAVAVTALIASACSVGPLVDDFIRQRSPLLVVTAIVAGAAVIYKLLGPREVVVGADGIALRGLVLRRFVPYESIAELVPTGVAAGDNYDTSIRCKNGESITLATALMTPGQREILLERVREGMQLGASTTSLEARLALLDQRGRSVEDWRSSLAALLGSKDHYRSSGLTVEEITAALADTTATAERRIGAAIALATHDASASTRIRVAADATANEPVRVALEKISAGDIDERAVERAMTAAQKR